ncbi:MAG TPA: ABC transporter permease, partial [Candidatus Acidoferrales bacterium]|nr:ABC transporter permease [Candidatus Acidoferrales bacterium]
MWRLLNWCSQVAAVTALNLRTLKERWGSSATAIFGVAGVVAVFVAVLSIAEGFRATVAEAGSRDVAIVMRGGSDTEMTSILSREETRIIADAPGVRRGPSGPVASAELFVLVDLPKRTTGTDANVPLRGIEPAGYQIRQHIEIVQGRRFEPGRNEVIVGRGALGQFAGLDPGTTLRLGQNQWEVVGVFTAGGTVAESEIWADASVVQSVYHRGSSFQSVYAKLNSPEAFDAFKDALTTDPRLNVKVLRETTYYAEQSRLLIGLVTGLGTLVAGLMGIGAVFGAVNTMYTAVSARTREIATLRALGFGASPVVISVLTESLLLALLGGLLGSGLAYLAFDGFQTATMNWQTFSQVAFAFRVTPSLLV